MQALSDIYIRETLADSPLIFERGKQTRKNGSYFISEKDPEQKAFTFQFDGAFGTYTTRIRINDTGIDARCTCPYPGSGCKHVVAAVLHARSLLITPRVQEELFPADHDPYLTPGEIKAQAIQDRQDRAENDRFTAERGDMFTGDHKVVSGGRRYTVCLHDPEQGTGHCSCPDYGTNGLGTCKHLLFMAGRLRQEPGFDRQVRTETLPFVDIFWDSLAQAPRLYGPRLTTEMPDLKPTLAKYFDREGRYTAQDISLIMGLMLRLHGDRRVRIRDNLLKRVDHRQQVLQLEKMKGRPLPKIPLIRPLYPYQEEGLAFGVLKAGVLIGDEMGLGKTVQAIGLSLMKCQIFGFSKILVITLASLRAQWQREITRTTRERATIIQGTPSQREGLYREKARFKITHYETALRDVSAISAFNPDIIILDEAQRIRNISTKTAEAVKQLPKKHAIVLTGTPIENKPEDLYSIVQFLDPYLFTPLWRFAADHFLIPREGGNTARPVNQMQAAGYRNLDSLKEKLSEILIRRTWDEVADQLPDQVVNNYYIDLAPEQARRHEASAEKLSRIVRKNQLSPMDLRQIQTQVLRMRMVCNSTFLVDRETQLSPKLRELSAIIDEVVGQNQRKTVIISEWTAMTYLIARHLSEAEIGFAQVSGKTEAGAKSEAALTFASDPDCRVFLTTDAGMADLDLSSARCLVHVELPWTKAQADQRFQALRPDTGRDLPPCHVINLMAAQSIEERIRAGLSSDPDLLTALFNPDPDQMEVLCRDSQDLACRIEAFLGSDLLPPAQVRPEEIPEEPEVFLFPEAMADIPDPGPSSRRPAKKERSGQAPFAIQDPDRLAEVLDKGFDFMAGLMELAGADPSDLFRDKAVHVDPETGRITLSFKLPPGKS